MLRAKHYLKKLGYKIQSNETNENIYNNRFQQIRRCKLALLLLGIEAVLIITFAGFVNYAPPADASDNHNSINPVFGGFAQNSDVLYQHFNLFQDVHVMILIGFGFLMTFLRKYGYSAVGFNFLLSGVIVQWSVICLGLFNLDDDYKINININGIFEADIATASVLISMGAVLGRTSYIQLILMGILEIAVYAGNLYFGQNILKVADAGGSIFVHTFGAYFGLAVSFVLHRKNEDPDSSLQESSSVSDLFAMIGTIFLWMFWPSFNAIDLTGDDQHRAVINTYYSLVASCVTAFAVSAMLTPEHKFDMVHIQNSTLAGGVAVGASANLMLQPYGALIVGMISGSISVYGYNVLSPWMARKLKIQDTCGVHNLHGMPGVLAGVVSVVMAGIASEGEYHSSLYEIFPARADNMTTFHFDLEVPYLNPGYARTAAMQAMFQAIALFVTIVLAIVAGLITGKIISMDGTFIVGHNNYADSEFWKLPNEAVSPKNFGGSKDGPILVFKPYIRSNVSSC